MLKNGELPDCLNFGQRDRNEEIIDVEKIQYNSFYKSYEFFENKFHSNLNFPGKERNYY